MIDTADPPRSAPRWFHVGAILTLGIVLFPLVLGQLVTTLRAGMADPKWPTEPWYLLSNYKLDVGYLVVLALIGIRIARRRMVGLLLT